MPGNGAARCASGRAGSRGSRRLTGRCSCPEARSAPRVVGRSGWAMCSTVRRAMRDFRIARPASGSHGWRLGSRDRRVHDEPVALCGDGLAVGTDLVAAAESATRQALEPLGGLRPDLVFVFVCGPEPDEASAALERAAQGLGRSHRRRLQRGRRDRPGAGRRAHVRRQRLGGRAARCPAAVVPSRGAHRRRLGGRPRAAAVAARRHAPRSCWPIPTRSRSTHSSSRCRTRCPGCPSPVAWPTGCAGRARPGCSSTAGCTSGAPSACCSGRRSAPARWSARAAGRSGPAMTVTAADGNVLLGLAGHPALDKLEEIVAWLPPADQALVTTRAARRASRWTSTPTTTTGRLPRAWRGRRRRRAGGADRRGRAVAVGQTVRFQVRDAESADADLAATLARFRDVGPPGESVDGALLFSCSGRGARSVRERRPRRARRARRAGDDGGGRVLCRRRDRPGRRVAPRLHGSTASVLAFS